MRLTPERLAATYACLRAYPPFCGMGLPKPEDVTFQVSRRKDQFAHYTRYVRSDHHFIVVSARLHGHLDTLMSTMAHEMTHLYQAIAKTEPKGRTQHNAQFKRIAARVCKQFGWDAKAFIGTT